jgi:hypothetical protein
MRSADNKNSRKIAFRLAIAVALGVAGISMAIQAAALPVLAFFVR